MVETKFIFEECEGGYALVGYRNPNDHVSIPDTYSGMPVVRIGNKAFRECWSLESWRSQAR